MMQTAVDDDYDDNDNYNEIDYYANFDYIHLLLLRSFSRQRTIRSLIRIKPDIKKRKQYM